MRGSSLLVVSGSLVLAACFGDGHVYRVKNECDRAVTVKIDYRDGGVGSHRLIEVGAIGRLGVITARPGEAKLVVYAPGSPMPMATVEPDSWEVAIAGSACPDDAL